MSRARSYPWRSRSSSSARMSSSVLPLFSSLASAFMPICGHNIYNGRRGATVPANRLPGHTLKVGREVLLGVSQDLDDGSPVHERERGPVSWISFLSGQDLPQPFVDRLLRAQRQRIERRRVDQVAAWILQ